MLNAVVCAENALTRAGLAALATSVTVVGQVGALTALDRWLQNQTADLALIECPALTPTVYDALGQLLEQRTAVPVLLLLDETEPDLQVQRRLQHMLSFGTVSLLPLTAGSAQVNGAIAAIATGLTVLSPDIADLIFVPPTARFNHPLSQYPEPLTAREIQVLNQLAAGSSNKAIAQALSISDHTVKFHISAIFTKLGVASRTEAVTVGIRAGLILL